MANDVLFKVFSAATASILETAINEWCASMSNKIELFEIKYAIAPRSGDNRWEVYSAIIVYGETDRPF
jgi:hypothetical protein